MTTRARSWCMTLCSFFSGPARPQLGSLQVETRRQLVLAVLLRPPPAAIAALCPGRQQQLLSISPPLWNELGRVRALVFRDRQGPPVLDARVSGQYV